MKNITDLFTDIIIIDKIQKKLPSLFQIAELDNSRDGKLGMEIGSARERIIVALLMYYFGKENINTNIPITQNETDVMVFNRPVSIKTITNQQTVGVKLIWTVDHEKAINFINSYKPECDLLYIHINWDSVGGIYLIPKETQLEVLTKQGKDFYFKLPKQGTNPRGVEISNDAMKLLIEHNNTKKIKINYYRTDSKNYSPYDKWVDLWEGD